TQYEFKIKPMSDLTIVDQEALDGGTRFTMSIKLLHDLDKSNVLVLPLQIDLDQLYFIVEKELAGKNIPIGHHFIIKYDDKWNINLKLDKVDGCQTNLPKRIDTNGVKYQPTYVIPKDTSYLFTYNADEVTITKGTAKLASEIYCDIVSVNDQL